MFINQHKIHNKSKKFTEKKGKKGLTKGGSGDIINKLSDANEWKRAKGIPQGGRMEQRFTICSLTFRWKCGKLK